MRPVTAHLRTVPFGEGERVHQGDYVRVAQLPTRCTVGFPVFREVLELLFCRAEQLIFWGFQIPLVKGWKLLHPGGIPGVGSQIQSRYFAVLHCDPGHPAQVSTLVQGSLSRLHDKGSHIVPEASASIRG